MKTRTLALAMTLAVTVSAVALAGTNTFGTSLTRGSKTTGKLSFKIKTNDKGTAVRVTSIKISDLKTRCVDENGTVKENGPVVAGTLGSADIKSPKETGSRSYSFNKVKRSGSGRFGVRGLLNRKGSTVQGEAYSDDTTPNCGGRGNYKAKRK